MKKLLSFLIAFILVFTFTACESEEAPKEITVAKPGYTCEAYVVYNSTEANLLLTATGGGIFSAEILTPDYIKGVKFSFDQEKVEIGYKEMSSDTAFSPEYQGIATLLNGIFMKITTGSITVPLKDGEYTYSGTSNNFPFTLTFNEQGYPVKLKMSEAGLIANFSKWKA